MSDKDEADEPKHDNKRSPFSTRKAKKLTKLKEYLSKQESLKNSRKVSGILKKKENDRTKEEQKMLADNSVIVKRIHKNKERRLLTEQRVLETEDSDEAVQEKCLQLAREIIQSKQTVIYTGAGISTAASIPDYRGPQGVWTLLQKGEQLVPQDLSDAEPTVTHMCITALEKMGHVSHVVSQNCDGLHLRSGLPRKALSEVHGNMYIEICYTCKPHREYIRLFDVTESTGVRRHQTGRVCKKCGGQLKDTIVHFGEKGGVKSPYRWKEAVKAANNSDLIICLGSSLKILKKYSCLWCMDRVRNKRPKLVIVNLQWTPKDNDSFLKINGRCDDVLQRVMRILKCDIAKYSRDADPIFMDAIALSKDEQDTTSKKILERPESLGQLPLKTVPRSRTPSVSSESETDTSGSSTESSDELESYSEDDIIVVPNDETSMNRNSVHAHYQDRSFTNGIHENKPTIVKHDFDISSIITKVKGRVQNESEINGTRKMTKEEMFMEKSEQICNEAKRAMQLKLNTADTDRKCAKVKVNPNNNLKNAKQQPLDTKRNGFHKEEQNSLARSQHLQSTLLLDPLRSLHTESITSYEERLNYLQTLQSQLQTLKQKQHILKQTDSSTPDTGLGGSMCTQTKGQESYDTQQTWTTNQSAKHLKTEQGIITSIQNPPQETCNASNIKNEANVQHNYMYDTNTQEYAQAFLIKEQKMNNDLIESQQKEFEKEKSDIKRQQENDHLRIYQQFVIQVQVAEQTNLGEQKKAEMMQAFSVQQKFMFSKQTAQLQELYRKHQSQRQALTTDIEKRHKQLQAIIQSAQLANPMERHTRPSISQQEQQTVTHQDVTDLHELQSQLNIYLPNETTNTGMFSPQHSLHMISPPAQLSQESVPLVHNDRNIKGSVLNQNDVKAISVISPKYEQLSRQINSSGTERKLVSPKQTAQSTNQTVFHSVWGDQKVEKDTKIPGFNELVEGIITCESCAFLKDYGTSKTQCPNCDNLKMKYGLVQKPEEEKADRNMHKHSVGGTIGPLYTQGKSSTGNQESHFLYISTSSDNQGLHGSHSASQFSSSNTSSISHSENQYFVSDTQNQSHAVGQYSTNITQSLSLPGIGGIQSISHVTAKSPNYLRPTSFSGRQPVFIHEPVSKPHHYSAIDNGSNTNYICHNQPESTSIIKTGLLECPDTSDQELSPVIPYASSSSSSSSSSTRVSKTSVIPKNILNVSTKNSSLAKQANFNVESGLPLADYPSKSSNTFSINYTKNEINNEASLTDVKLEKNDEWTIDNLMKLNTPIRPRSQSEISKFEDGKVSGVSEMRLARSHSHSEVLETEATYPYESYVSVKGIEEAAGKIGKKRKSSTNVSVPGWFGKGLNLKKKRKY